MEFILFLEQLLLAYPSEESKLYPGIGIFVTEAGSPLRLLGGASAERIDGAWQINLQIGIPFE